MNIDVALGLSDPLLITRWFVNLPGLQQPTDVVVENIEIAFPKVGSKQRRGQGQSFFYPEVEEVDAITMAVYETHDLMATRYFENWYREVKDEDGNYGVPEVYKKTLYAHLYHRERNVPVATFTFEGAWPLDRSGFNMTYEDDAGRVIKSVQLQIDRAKFKLQQG